MLLWRISRFPDLAGMGGVLASGRWHTMPKPVIYCADHPASALLEVFVHLGVDPEDIPDGYRMIAVEAPETVSVTRIADDALTPGWRNDMAETRTIGDAWCTGMGSALLDVPSAIVPRSRIIVVNARHSDATALRIVEDGPVAFDPRLWK